MLPLRSTRFSSGTLGGICALAGVTLGVSLLYLGKRAIEAAGLWEYYMPSIHEHANFYPQQFGLPFFMGVAGIKVVSPSTISPSKPTLHHSALRYSSCVG